MASRVRRVSSPIRTAAQFFALAILAAIVIPLYLKALPEIRRKNAYHDVWCAANTERPDLLRDALQRGGSPNAHDPADETALMVAARNGNASCCQLLLDYGADPNLRGSENATPLLDYDGADRNALRSGGATPLHYATRVMSSSIVSMLLEKGANTELRDAGGNTPLMLAAWMGDMRTIRLLLNSGANPNQSNNAGEKPLRLAQRSPINDEPTLDHSDKAGRKAARRGNADVVDLLRRSGASE